MTAPAENWSPLYDELRRLAAGKLAGERPGHTLDATALVHEAYFRLGDASFADRSEFLRAAAVAMQRILVDHARRKLAAKRGGLNQRVSIDEFDRAPMTDPDTVLDIDDALNRLNAEDATSAEIARLRLFAGLSIDEAADALGIARASAFREWAYARSWLTAALTARQHSNPASNPKESIT